MRRPLMFALLPVALVVGGYFYVTGGAVMSTDNAYVQADMIGPASWQGKDRVNRKAGFGILNNLNGLRA